MSGTFSLDLSKFCAKYDTDMKLVIRKISFEAFKRVILRTPVDTGRARSNWSVSIDQPVVYHVTDTASDKSGSASLKQAADGTKHWECEGSLFLCNFLPYIWALEYGHSKQAPQGMVRLTVTEMILWLQGVTKESVKSINSNINL